jgi:hypothetical protein
MATLEQTVDCMGANKTRAPGYQNFHLLNSFAAGLTNNMPGCLLGDLRDANYPGQTRRLLKMV